MKLAYLRYILNPFPSVQSQVFLSSIFMAFHPTQFFLYHVSSKFVKSFIDCLRGTDLFTAVSKAIYRFKYVFGQEILFGE